MARNRRPRNEGSTALGIALVNLTDAATSLRGVVDSMGRMQLSSNYESEVYLYLYHLSAIKMHCFVEALDYAVRQAKQLPNGADHLRRLGPVLRPFQKSKAAIQEFRNQVVAHGTPRVGMQHEAVRIAQLDQALRFDRWVFLAMLSESVAELFAESFLTEYVAAERVYGMQFDRSKKAAVERIGGKAKIKEILAEISALVAQVPPARKTYRPRSEATPPPAPASSPPAASSPHAG